jgi:hypothetical protein
MGTSSTPDKSNLQISEKKSLQRAGQTSQAGKSGNVEKLLYSRKDAAFALSLSMRSIDYLIAGKHLLTRRIGNRILIPADEIRRFARANHFGSIAS